MDFIQDASYNFSIDYNIVQNTTYEVFDEKYIINFLSRRIGKIDAVVFSGGEALLYPDIKQLISVVKDMGFLIKIDTNGLFPDILQKLIDSRLVDYIAIDYKSSKKRLVEIIGWT